MLKIAILKWSFSTISLKDRSDFMNLSQKLHFSTENDSKNSKLTNNNSKAGVMLACYDEFTNNLTALGRSANKEGYV